VTHERDKRSKPEVLSGIRLVSEAIDGDYFSTRDPNVAALCKCFGQTMTGHRTVLVRYGNRSPQRVVEFQFAGHDKVFKAATMALLDIRSSQVIQNVNAGEFLAHLKNLKTIILSMG